MISPAHLANVRSYIELGPKEGASLLCGGLGTPELPERVKRGNYVLPTVFADVDNRMRIAQEEIFGPVACLIRSRRGRCDPPGQRHRVRPVELRVDREPRTRATAWLRRSMPACASSTARTCATCASRSAGTKASGTVPRRRHLSFEVVRRTQERMRVDQRPPHPALGRVTRSRT